MGYPRGLPKAPDPKINKNINIYIITHIIKSRPRGGLPFIIIPLGPTFYYYTLGAYLLLLYPGSLPFIIIPWGPTFYYYTLGAYLLLLYPGGLPKAPDPKIKQKC